MTYIDSISVAGLLAALVTIVVFLWRLARDLRAQGEKHSRELTAQGEKHSRELGALGERLARDISAQGERLARDISAQGERLAHLEGWLGGRFTAPAGANE